MGSDLIAWIVAIALGLAVIGLGLRRNLADTTQDWLPRFGKAPEPASATPELYVGGQGRRQLSPRQRQWAIWAYLLFSLCNVIPAVLSADNRLLHVFNAALFAIGAVVFALRKSPSSLDGATS